jgi:hypothetical protein
MMSDGGLPADCERAWLAGFVDGEGTIGMTLGRNGRTIHVYITIPNTNLANMARARVLLRAILGRDVRVSKPERKDHRPIFVIAVQNRPDIKAILEMIRPWLVGKRPQADLMLEYIKLAPIRMVPRSASNRRSHAVSTDRHTEVHYELVRKMHLLNRRFAPGQWSDDPPSVNSEGRLEWPDRSDDEDDKDDQLKRWWRLHFGY